MVCTKAQPAVPVIAHGVVVDPQCHRLYARERAQVHHTPAARAPLDPDTGVFLLLPMKHVVNTLVETALKQAVSIRALVLITVRLAARCVVVNPNSAAVERSNH